MEAKWGNVIQNLRDAGCEDDFARRFIQLLENGRRREAQNLLEKHRQTLLERCHAEERKIGCLDYLIYRMEKHQV
ncbi:MAG TPA: hypothetical protein H9694_10585 [Firmicutes bacterium]|nr:hypothetical protein [Bacillota bacterium]